jgi:putative phosphoesterase
MKIGFLSDAHGNPFGFLSCIEHLYANGAEAIYFLGDAVGYWPFGIDIIQRLIDLEVPCLKGNHEGMILGFLKTPEEKEDLYRLNQIKMKMTDEMSELIRETWHERLEIKCDGKRILLVHGRPSNPLEGYLYENGEFVPNEGGNFDVIVMGHTHRPFIKYNGKTLWLNVGSCGLPRDMRNMASFALYDTILDKAEICRVGFDVDKLVSLCPSESVSDSFLDYVNQYRG